MTIKQVRKDMDKEVNKLLEEISDLEIQVKELLDLGNKNDSVYASLSKIKGVESYFENNEFFITVPLDEKIKARQINTDNFMEYFGDKLDSMKAENISEVFETPNTIGVFADIDGESIEITANRNNTLDSLCITVSGINESGLVASDIKKTKKKKLR